MIHQGGIKYRRWVVEQSPKTRELWAFGVRVLNDEENKIID